MVADEIDLRGLARKVLVYEPSSTPAVRYEGTPADGLR
jgi:hypothetical protein